MSSFFTDLLEQFPGDAFLKKVCDKFHYEEERTGELRKVAEEMLPLLRREAFWERTAEEETAPETETGSRSFRTGCAKPPREWVILSLGPGVDALQEQYGEQGFLSKSYMLEALAGELLMQGYGAYNRYIAETTDWHVARYHFPGSEEAYPLEMLPAVLAGFTDRVVCNKAFCLLPKKSVIFAAELTQDAGVCCEGICVGCNSVHCANRLADDFRTKQLWTKTADVPLNYGYSRIFGRL